MPQLVQLYPISRTVPVFWGHGVEDAQVNHAFWAVAAETAARDLNINFVKSEAQSKPTLTFCEAAISKVVTTLRFMSYEGLGHWFSQEELKDMAIWIIAMLADSEDTQGQTL